MRKTFTIAIVALLAACCGPTDIDARAERARFDAIAPEYRELVEGARRESGEAWFSAQQQADRIRTVEEWEAYVIDLEAAVAEGGR